MRGRPWVRRPDSRHDQRMDAVGGAAEISSSKEAANNALVLAFGRLQGAANRLEYLLGRSLEQEHGIGHLMFEVLLILGRAGDPGLSMRAIAQAQVLTTGGATRLVDRMEAAGLVERAEDPGDRRPAGPPDRPRRGDDGTRLPAARGEHPPLLPGAACWQAGS